MTNVFFLYIPLPHFFSKKEKTIGSGWESGFTFIRYLRSKSNPN